MIDVIYPVHNRLFYTQITFPRLLHECIKTNSKLWIYDDESDDGSYEFILDVLKRSGYENYFIHHLKIGNSTYCINQTLRYGENPFLYKVDNDCIIPEGAFDFMIENIPETCGFLMMKETGDFPCIVSRDLTERVNIGGIGLFRRKAFDQGNIQSNNRYFGFTEYQKRSKWKRFEINAYNTILDKSPYYSREKEYEEMGWGRSLCNVESVFEPNKNEDIQNT